MHVRAVSKFNVGWCTTRWFIPSTPVLGYGTLGWCTARRFGIWRATGTVAPTDTITHVKSDLRNTEGGVPYGQTPDVIKFHGRAMHALQHTRMYIKTCGTGKPVPYKIVLYTIEVDKSHSVNHCEKFAFPRHIQPAFAIKES